MKALRTFFTLAATGLTLLSAHTASAEQWVDDYNSLLKKYVSKGGVKYAEWKANAADVATLDAITKHIGDTKVSGDTNTQKAFYINAYNAWVIDLVLDRWPTKSILPRGRGNFFTKTQIKVAGRPMSLDDLEKKTIFPRFRDARIHFAINCGSKGCPPLYSRAFKAETLDAQLDRVSTNFINSKDGVEFSKNKLTVSRIFDWYKKDFVRDSGSVIKFINKFSKKEIPQRKLDFSEYSWDVNAVK